MKLKPLSNNVLIELIEEQDEQKTESGIILLDTAEKSKQSKGIVKAIGPGKLTEGGNRLPVSVKVGDNVFFKKPWGDENKIVEDKKERFLIEESDILAVIE